MDSLREFLSRLISNRLGRVSVVTATQHGACREDKDWNFDFDPPLFFDGSRHSHFHVLALGA
jgi:hypothetical protein